jgi:hypothetical protein
MSVRNLPRFGSIEAIENFAPTSSGVAGLPNAPSAIESGQFRHRDLLQSTGMKLSCSDSWAFLAGEGRRVATRWPQLENETQKPRLGISAKSG